MGKHRLGYGGINTTLHQTTNRTCRLRNISPDRIAHLIQENLTALQMILSWNQSNRIGLFRIGSGFIPYGAHSLNTLAWPMAFSKPFGSLGAWVEQQGMRLTMHPGQYLTLNSPTPSVVQTSIDDLIYHTTLLSTMGLDTTCKIIIHLGGLYGDKKASMHRFIRAYTHLPGAVKRRLVLEHDDRLFTVWDVLAVSEEIGIPVVFDTLHHEVNNNGRFREPSLRKTVMRCLETWESSRDGLPIVHFASQRTGARPGAHAHSIDVEALVRFVGDVGDQDFDLELECKDKEKSVLAAQKVLGPSHFQGLVYVA